MYSIGAAPALTHACEVTSEDEMAKYTRNNFWCARKQKMSRRYRRTLVRANETTSETVSLARTEVVLRSSDINATRCEFLCTSYFSGCHLYELAPLFGYLILTLNVHVNSKHKHLIIK